jgi:hypothetical protein
MFSLTHRDWSSDVCSSDLPSRISTRRSRRNNRSLQTNASEQVPDSALDTGADRVDVFADRPDAQGGYAALRLV